MPVPSAPIITAEPTAGVNSLTFSWAKPSSNGGSHIIRYELCTQDFLLTVNLQLSDSPYTWTGLTNFISYSFMIRAVNSIGNSDYASYTATQPIETVPGIPVVGNEDSMPTASDGALTFTWSAPISDGGTVITKYWLYEFEKNLERDLQLNQSPYTWTGLTNGTSYTFLLKAENSVGSGPIFEYSTQKPSIGGSTPSAPNLIGAKIRPIALDQSIKIYFDPPSDPGSGIDSYKYFLNMDYETPYTIPLENTDYTITSLTNGTDYTIEIGANTSGGLGALARYRTVQPGNKPFIPISINVTNPTSTSALVTWEPPENDGGATIKWYVITPYSSDPEDPFTAYNSSASAEDASYGHYGKRSAHGTDRSIVFSGLTQGNTYTFGVNAVNDPGYSLERKQI